MTVGTTNATDVNLVTGNTARVIVSSAGHLLPAANSTYNLGSSTLQWGSAWLGGNLSVGGSGSITGSLSVGGNGSITGNLSVGGSGSITGSLSVSGNGSITGNLSVSGSTVTLSGIPGGSTATDVLVRTGTGDVQYRAASELVGTYAWLLTGNSITSAWNGSSGNFLGTTNAQPLVIATTNTASPQPIQVWVGNQETFRFNPPGTSAPAWSIQRGGGNQRGLHAVDLQSERSAATQVASGNYSVIGGGYNNTAIGYAATIGGGYNNTASGSVATIGGGQVNTASGPWATVGGGGGNTAGNNYATVGGGLGNTASGYIATVGGGLGNTASGTFATVGGGASNTASSTFATVGGGYLNTASGDYSAIPGGYNLRVGTRSFGFSGQTSTTQTDLSANSNIAAFVDVDLWLYNVRNQASQLRLYEPSGAGTNFTAFRAQAQANDIIYTLPASLTPTSAVGAGILQTDGSGNLSWLTPSALVTGIAWALTGNSGTDPAVNFLGTTDAQPLVIRTNNTERMRVTATGNVGIGTSAPAQRLHVVGNVQFTGALMPAGAAGSAGQVLVSLGAGAAPEWWYIVSDGTTTTVNIGGGQIEIAANHVLPIWNAGQIQGNNVSGAAPNNGYILVWNVGTNQWEPNPVTVAGAWGLTGNGGTNPAFNFLGTTDDQPVIIKTNGVERMRISNSAYNGYVGIGVTNPSYRLELPNQGNPAGRGRANSWVTYSSMRWKEEIRPIENALERVMQLRGYRFRWKPEYGGTEDIGFLAEEVARVVPEVVSYEPDGQVAGMDYSRLTALLVEALKQQQREIAELRSLVEQLLRQNGERGTGSQPSTIQDAWLGQNIPNPFAGTTTIPYYIPAGVSRAELVVRDVGGRELRRLELAERGAHGQVVLEMGLLGSGTYEYALVLDGRVVAVKQMTLVR
jgi:hypothetical protein